MRGNRWWERRRRGHAYCVAPAKRACKALSPHAMSSTYDVESPPSAASVVGTSRRTSSALTASTKRSVLYLHAHARNGAQSDVGFHACVSSACGSRALEAYSVATWLGSARTIALRLMLPRLRRRPPYSFASTRLRCSSGPT